MKTPSRAVIEEARQVAIEMRPHADETAIADFSIGYIASKYETLVIAVADLLENPSSLKHQSAVRIRIETYTGEKHENTTNQAPCPARYAVQAAAPVAG